MVRERHRDTEVPIMAETTGGSAAVDESTMRATAKVELITPDPRSLQVIGPNPYDPARRGPVAVAGRSQGRRAAAGVADLWR
jgi:NTE family protein